MRGKWTQRRVARSALVSRRILNRDSTPRRGSGRVWSNSPPHTRLPISSIAVAMRSESLRVEWMTPLNKTLKRALKIKGEDYVVTLSPEFLKISRKGHRLGLELSWVDLVSGETLSPLRCTPPSANFRRPQRNRL